MLTIEQVKDNGWLIFETIAGSRAYGLATAHSDTDIRGVFVLPKEQFYSLDYTPQVSNATNDIVYYELKRFIELLAKNNPNIMEMLNVPDDCVVYRHPVMNKVKPGLFLSKLCRQAFANYAFTQIKKAYGLEKKIVNPVEPERKSVLDFCFVHEEKMAIPLKRYLESKGLVQEQLGLTAVSHMRDCYNLYSSPGKQYAGIVRKQEANDVCLSSVPVDEPPVGILYFNKDGYSVYCKKYREYREWEEKRNEERYRSTLSHGKRYDAKNMMHVFRLLLMAKEIATEGMVNVRRKDRDFLLAVKAGQFEYDDLVKQAEDVKDELDKLYEASPLQEQPDMKTVNNLLVEMRNEYYGK